MPINPAQPPKFTKVALGAEEYSVELNDANFEATSWKNPRYDGCQTKTTELNKYNNNDITFGKTAATQKYSRNIYFGNAVIGLNDTPEDTRLMRIENFSYIQTNRFFTINDDDSISVQRIESTKDNVDSKLGFYRSFYEDFPEGNECRVIVADDSIKNSLEDRYTIYFNGGVLKKLFTYIQPSDSNTEAFLTFGGNQQTHTVQYLKPFFNTKIEFYNENDIRKFYTGSLETVDQLGAQFSYAGNSIEVEYFQPFFDYRDNAAYKGDKRLFVSFCTESNSGSAIPGNHLEPIRTISKDSMPEGELFNTKNLGEISTSEVSDITFDSFNYPGPIVNGQQITLPGQRQKYVLSNRFKLNFAYNPFHSATIPAVRHNRILLTLCEDTIPSLLLNLPKDEHLPDGIGRKGFVVIPENIHPHIKQNLVHYLAKAGISLGTDVVPALDNTYRKLM